MARVTPRDREILREMKRKLDKRTPPPVEPPQRGGHKRGDESVWVRVESSTRDGSNWRWLYQVREVRFPLAGYGSHQSPAGAPLIPARNTLENMNTTTGRLGNGVLLSNLPAGMTLQPAPAGAIVRAFWSFDGLALWFTYENGVDGTCPPT